MNPHISGHVSGHVRGTVLEIRRLHIALGDGRSTTFSTVLCPARRRAVPVEECLDCKGTGGIVTDPTARFTYVSCREKPAPVRPAFSGSGEPSLADRTPVSRIMSTQVTAVRPDVTLEALTALFLEQRIGGAPVVDAQGRPVGMLTKTDLLRDRLERGDADGEPESAATCRRLGPGFHAEHVPSATVAGAMTHSVFTVTEGASVAEAAALMSFENIHRVPVVSADGRVVGMLDTLDVLRWVAQQDGYLAPSRAGLRAW